MCVKQTADNTIPEGMLSMATFDELSSVFPDLDAMILSGVGEPLLHPQLEQFIRKAKSAMPAKSWVGIQSNGCLANITKARSLLRSGLDKICLSVDALAPEVFRHFRKGAEVDDLDRALSVLTAAKKQAAHSVLQVGIQFVLMRDNLAELPGVLRWAAAKGIDFAIVSQLLPYDRSLTGQVVYNPNTDASMALYKKWQRNARAEGLDLRDYFKALILYSNSRSPAQHRLMKLVQQMKEEAVSLGIPVLLRRLIQEDSSLMDRAEVILEEARSIASSEGLKLVLPTPFHQNVRRCEFVEDGGVFISWDGSVHPCYALWHQYACFIDGRKKYVKARRFGNVTEKALLDIWNDADFFLIQTECAPLRLPLL
jgi:putative metalloenzyme radical SAM/SPASM domain maturase